MIEFRELRITPDSKYLIIDAAIKADASFVGRKIQEVGINYVDENLILSNPEIHVLNISDKLPTEEELDKYQDDDEINISTDDDTILTINKTCTHIRYIIPQKTIANYSLAKGIFIVSIAATEDTPIEYANTTIEGIVINLYSYYKYYIKKIKLLGNTCHIPKDLVASVLEMKALELSVKMGDSEQAAKYWYSFSNKLNN